LAESGATIVLAERLLDKAPFDKLLSTKTTNDGGPLEASESCLSGKPDYPYLKGSLSSLDSTSAATVNPIKQPVPASVPSRKYEA
jgi:hypothetical protein